MFQFYQDVIEWYLHSKVSRVFLSFNEKVKNGFKDATEDLEDCINELYREAAIGSTAMVAMIAGKEDEPATVVAIRLGTWIKCISGDDDRRQI